MEQLQALWEQIVSGIASVNGAINSVVWGVPMLVLIIATGIYLTVRTKFFQVSHFGHVNKETFLAIFRKRSVTKTKEKHSISQFQALSTALAATVGTGNIAGVATAIAIGGPGAVFWMWLSAFFGMMTNYSENVLGIFYRRRNPKGEWSGGAMYYLRDGLGSKKHMKTVGKVLAVIFSVFCMLASFGIGNMTQVNNISKTLEHAFTPFGLTEIPPIVTGLVLAGLVALVIIGGIKRIGSVTEKVVPFMAVLYIVGTLVILFANIGQIPEVFSAIFKGAFGLTAIGGGIAGAAVKQAVTMGFKRGVFSNEAGLGSSVMVHSASDVKEPVVQGMWGIFEVFFDTIIICTLTAFCILSSGAYNMETGQVINGMEGAQLVTYAFSNTIHEFAGAFVAIATLFFALSTVLGWSFYGTKATEFLFGTKATIVYKIVFVAFIVVGATMDLSLAWDIADTLNGLMAIPNLIGVLSLSGTVFAITRNYVGRRIQKQPSGETPMLSAFDDIQAEQLQKMQEEQTV